MMLSTLLTTCIGDSCGWIAAFIALFAAGTYGVPIKQTMYQITDLNPFVFQTYKVLVFFVVSIITVFVFNVPFRMTFYYGTLSGMLWVCGGTGGIVAVRYAGLATAVGTWASIMICINFSWGILVFHEPVVNIYNTMSAFLLLTLGLVGMSTYGDPANGSKSTSANQLMATQSSTSLLVVGSDHHDRSNTSGDNDDVPDSSTYKKRFLERFLPSRRSTFSLNGRRRSYSDDEAVDSEESSENSLTGKLLKQRKIVSVKDSAINDEETATESDSISSTHSSTSLSSSSSTGPLNYNPETHVRIFNNMIITKRTAGILAALFNGFMSGSSLIPMHFAKRHGGWGGLNYLISFSVGSMISCFGIWFVYYIILVVRQHRTNKKSSNASNNNAITIIITNTNCTDEVASPSSTMTAKYYFCNLMQQAASKMPDAYWKILWKSGLAAGLLNAIAMVGSVLAVTYLGQGVGNSVIQCKIIVSGMWGIFYYKEVDNPATIRKWFISASFSVVGIIWLSLERIKAMAQSS